MTGFSQSSSSGSFAARLRRSYIIFTLSFVVLILVLGWQESRGLPGHWVGYAFLLATVCLYAFIGIICRTSDAREYYVAGRAVPAFYNGMATAADWMSVASFMGIAGTLYMTGYNGLAFVMGWTGGYVLLALLLAPYLRKFGQYTIPDFMGARYGGNMARMAGVLCATLCSLIYLVAQVYGIGMITSRLTSMSFELGILIALGGMLVCSFLGGMRAVTWTQVGQYIIMLVAYLVPVVWLSVKHAQTPVPQVAATRMLPTIDLLNNEVLRDPGEIEVRALWAARADAMQARLDALPQSWATERARMRAELQSLQTQRSSWVDIRILERELASYPENAAAARDQWIKARNTYRARAAPPTAQGSPCHAAARRPR
ncbi:MAG: VC_2705 family sodium/solute symporter, partial [Burkholderiaceae bacterium]|nr:VC_2705 family sodium/solute symporter [Burkholderiaceae bacterium]